MADHVLPGFAFGGSLNVELSLQDTVTRKAEKTMAVIRDFIQLRSTFRVAV